MTSLPLQSEADFENALAEANTLLRSAPAPGSARERRLDEILGHIAEYHEEQPPERQAARLDALQALDAHLKAYGRHWRKDNDAGQPEHWSPMLGGDLDPTHQHH